MRKNILVAVIVLGAVFLVFSPAYAGGDAENGKALFNDQTLGGSTNDKSCNTCHSGGSGLEGSGNKKFTAFMGAKVTSLEDVINICIERPLGGKALDKGSKEMQDIVSYIKSLGK